MEKALIGRYIKISAQNGFGGYSTSIYLVLNGSLYTTEDVNSIRSDSNASVSKINSKLQEYKQSQGWL